VQHYERRLEAMEGKTMIVCMSRRIRVEMYNALIKLRPEWANGANDDDNGKSCLAKIVMTGSARTILQSAPLPNSLPFEDRRQALSYPDAERGDAARGAGASHLVDQRRGQAGALQPSG
jgi:hypothetical protein